MMDTHIRKETHMPPTMQPMMTSRTKRARMYKRFELVHVGPIRLYFSFFELIAFESDKTKVVVGAPSKASANEGEMNQHRLMLEPDKAKWVSPSDFSEKWTEVSEIYFK
jgi:hypothetical protein